MYTRLPQWLVLPSQESLRHQ